MRFVHTRKNFWLLCSGALLFYTAFSILPIVLSFCYSFTNFRGFGKFTFLGLKNYQKLFSAAASLAVFSPLATFLVGTAMARNSWSSVMPVRSITVTQMAITLPFSFLLAMVVNRQTVKNAVYKTILFSPYIIPAIMSGIIWKFMFEPNSGFINTVLRAIHLDGLAVQWIGGRSLTPVSVGIAGAWSSIGFCFVLWSTGLKSIPSDVLEAAVMDGASKRQLIRHTSLPLLKNTFKVICLFQLTGCIQSFEMVYKFTGGGPNHASETLISYLYTKTFVDQSYGFGMAIAVIEFLISLIIALVFMALSSRDAVQGGKE